MSSQSKQQQASSKVSTQINSVQILLFIIEANISPMQQYTATSQPSRDIPRDTQPYHSIQRDWVKPKHGKEARVATPTMQPQSDSIMSRWLQQEYSDEPYNNVAGVVSTSRNMKTTTAKPSKSVKASDKDSLKADDGRST